MKKILITGASGLLGRAFVQEFEKNNWNVKPLAFKRSTHYESVDLRDFKTVRKVVQEFEPDVILHSAAIRSPETVKNHFSDSYFLNVESSRNLAEIAREINAIFLYISTDYVLSGDNSPYKETDSSTPVNLYGRLKLEGEKAILEVYPDSLVLRVPVLYGDEEYVGESVVSVLANSLQANQSSKNPLHVNNFEVRYPCLTADIAKICYQLIQKKIEDFNLNGIFQWSGKERLTKYQMVLLLGELLNLSLDHVAPIDQPSEVSTGCERPLNTQMSCERLFSLGINYDDYYTSFKDGILNHLINKRQMDRAATSDDLSNEVVK